MRIKDLFNALKDMALHMRDHYKLLEDELETVFTEEGPKSGL